MTEQENERDESQEETIEEAGDLCSDDGPLPTPRALLGFVALAAVRRCLPIQLHTDVLRVTARVQLGARRTTAEPAAMSRTISPPPSRSRSTHPRPTARCCRGMSGSIMRSLASPRARQRPQRFALSLSKRRRSSSVTSAALPRQRLSSLCTPSLASCPPGHRSLAAPEPALPCPTLR